MNHLAFWLAAPASAMRVGLGLLFARAAWGKARDLPGFVAVVTDYRLLPYRLAPAAAGGLVAAEVVAAVLLLSGAWTMVAGLVASFLLLLFAGAMAVNLLRGRVDISCGCLPTYASRPRLSWRGVLATTCLVPPALLATLSWPDADVAGAMQAALAGLLLFTLHDAALRLAALPRAGVRG